VPGQFDGKGGLGFVAMQACADQVKGVLAFDAADQGVRMVLRFDPAVG
jgi:hypothetical protein